MFLAEGKVGQGAGDEEQSLERVRPGMEFQCSDWWLSRKTEITRDQTTRGLEGHHKEFAFLLCSTFISADEIKHSDQSNIEKKGFIWFTSPGHRLPVRKGRAGTQAGTEAESTRWGWGALLEAGTGSCSAIFLIHPMTTCPSDGTSHSGLDPPTLIHIKTICP